MMNPRRVWFFVLLGPFLIWLIFLAMALVRRDEVLLQDWRWLPASLLGSYGIALLPLLVIANIDHRLSRSRWRVLVCFLVGFGGAVALFYSFADSEAAEKQFQQDWFFVGLMIGLPAAVCSWLSGRYATDGQQR